MKYFLLVFCLSLGVVFSSCTSDDDDFGAPVDNSSNEYRLLKLMLPNASSGAPSTYAVNILDENKVSTLDLLVFGYDGTDEKFLYRSKATTITNTNVDGSVKSFKVWVSNSKSGEPIRFVLVANAADVIDAAGISKGDKKADVLAALEFSTAGIWNAANSSVFKAIPMWGESESLLTITSTTNTFPTIKVMRAMAKIDVGVNFTDITQDPVGLGTRFKLKDVYVYNVPNKGMAAPLAANVSANKATAPSLPTVYSINAPLHYTSSDISSDGFGLLKTIYIPEVEEGSSVTRAVAPFLILGGSFEGGATTYYRVDFLKKPAIGDTDDTYIPVLRNHRYVFNITQVIDAGYSSIQDAIDFSSVNSIGVSQTYYDESITSIIYDEGFMLGLSHHEMKLDYTEYSAANSNEVIITAYTDHPNGFTSQLDPLCTWARITQNASGSQGQYVQIHIEVDQNIATADRSVDMTFSFGRRTETITITQTDELSLDGVIDITPGEDIEMTDVETGVIYTFRIDNTINETNNSTNGMNGIFHTTSGLPPGLSWFNNSIFNPDYGGGTMGTPETSFRLNVGKSDNTAPSMTFIPPTESWITEFTFNHLSYTGSSWSTLFYFNAAPDPDYQSRTGGREAEFYFCVDNFKIKLKIVQDIKYCLYKKGDKVYDNLMQPYEITTDTFIATTHNMFTNDNLPSVAESRYDRFPDWYYVNNVPYGWDSSADPSTNQLSPANEFSCARLNEVGYLGFYSGWRVPTIEEVRYMIIEKKNFLWNRNSSYVPYSDSYSYATSSTSEFSPENMCYVNQSTYYSDRYPLFQYTSHRKKSDIGFCRTRCVRTTSLSEL